MSNRPGHPSALHPSRSPGSIPRDAGSARKSGQAGDAPLDLLGVGIGPSNLSLAAQLDGIDDVGARFFDRLPTFDWHPGMMLPDVELQSSFLKDLVTSTNPTSPWSFIAYLVAKKKLFAFLNANFDAVPRLEFAHYFAWAAEGLACEDSGSLSFGSEIREIDFDGESFVVRFDDGTLRATNLSLGVGPTPFVPRWAEGLLGDDCFHCSRATALLPGLAAERVAVVGGGQSGGEIVQHLLSRATPPQQLHWLSRRHNFEPINDSPFSNQVFSPEYVDAFRALAPERKQAAIGTHTLTSDGLSLSTIDAIYRRIYQLRHIEESEHDVRLLPNRDVVQIDRQHGEYRLIVRNAFDGGIEILFADAIVLATGYAFAVPKVLAPIAGRLALDRQGRLSADADYSVAWDGPRRNRIFAQNAARHSHGIADAQLSLVAWRSATIVNALVGRQHFDLELPRAVVDWPTGQSRRGEVPAAHSG